MNLHNEHCNVALRHVNLAVEQHLRMSAQGHHFNKVYTLTHSEQEGVAARQAEIVHRTLTVDLKNIRYVAPTERKVKGTMKALSKEDRFMIENMQPACHAHHVQNEYFLTVRCSYEGCTCCAGLPHAKIPLNIVPIVNPECYGFAIPQDF